MSNINILLHHPVQVNGRNTAGLVREALMFQARGPCILLSMVNWVSFWKERCLSVFSWVSDINFVQYHRLQVNGRKTAIFVRESLMLGTRWSSNLVNIVNSVCSLKDYWITLSVFLDEQHHLSAEAPHSSEWEKHCSSCKRSIKVTRKTALHLVKHGELS
jgi:hypothetical protein